MKHMNPQRLHRAFTLIEMLVVIAIIGTLAGLLLPTLARVKVKARMVQAQTEIKTLATAVTAYQALYGVYPCSEPDIKGAPGVGPVDLTYATTNNNIILILMDVDTDKVPLDINKGHRRNPQKHVFLNAKLVTSTNQPGVAGLPPNGDYIFRDPWGNPYIFTLDLNFDNACQDKFYGRIPAPVLVWSCGPNRKPFGPSNLPDAKDNDDVRSW
jgi:prepilin-type N-terminal cleavage/methylation domain-containing protein